MRLFTGAMLAAVALMAGIAVAADQKVSVGDQVGDLTFKDIRYLRRTLDDFGRRKAFVFVCMSTTCPEVQRRVPKLLVLESDYRDRGVQFLSLYTSDDDSVLEMAEHALQLDIPFPAVQDIDGLCVQKLGVSRTPEVAVLDSKRMLRYRGRIDHQYRTNGTQADVTEDNLKDALDAVLAGNEVAVKETPVEGTLITPPRKLEARTDLTYAEHIRPLLEKHCTECHQPGTEAPFSLTTYDDVIKQGAMLAEVVAEGRMPPWYAGPSHAGQFMNERGMSQPERDCVLQWVAAGMAAGNLGSEAEQGNPSGKRTGGWLMGEPDMIIKADRDELPAEGYIPYVYAIPPYLFPHDTWIQSFEILPDNPRVVHHCRVGAIPFDSNDLLNDAFMLTGKVPGMKQLNLEGTGMAFHLPKGMRLVLEIHYTSTGQPESCQVAVGIKYYRGVVRKRLQTLIIKAKGFAIPPDASHHKAATSVTLASDAVGVNLVGHMHLRGKDISFSAAYPDGTTERLLTVPNYNFDWQLGYDWRSGVKKFPSGTKIEVVGHFDNSAFNPYNPDPSAEVTYGLQTFEEMCEGYLFYVDADENLSVEVDPKTGQGPQTGLEAVVQVLSPLFGPVIAWWNERDATLRVIIVVDALIVAAAAVWLARKCRGAFRRPRTNSADPSDRVG